MDAKKKKKVTEAITHYLHADTGMSLGIISERFRGISAGQLRRVLNEMIAEGVVVRDGERGQATYRLVKPC